MTTDTSNTPKNYSVCEADGCDLKIFKGTRLCPVHRALKQYEAPTAPQPDFEAINKYLDDAPVPTENRVVLDADDPRVFNPLAASQDSQERCKACGYKQPGKHYPICPLQGQDSPEPPHWYFKSGLGYSQDLVNWHAEKPQNATQAQDSGEPSSITVTVANKELMFGHTAVNQDMHLFVDGVHNPKLCPECIQPGLLVQQATQLLHQNSNPDLPIASEITKSGAVSGDGVEAIRKVLNTILKHHDHTEDAQDLDVAAIELLLLEARISEVENWMQIVSVYPNTSNVLEPLHTKLHRRHDNLQALQSNLQQKGKA